MTELVLLKRDSCREYRDYLLSTTNATLIEQTNHEFWGEGRLKTGKNFLGMIHTEVRENLFQHLKKHKKYLLSKKHPFLLVLILK